MAHSARSRFLLTGIAGFVGSHLAEALLGEGHEVVGVDAFTDGYSAAAKEENLAAVRRAAGLRVVRGDLAALDLVPLLEGVEVVYHLAARAGVRSSWGSEFDRYAHDNLLASQRLLEAARGARIRRFVYASSSSVYGNARELPVTEESPTEPVSPYGVTKLAAEHLGRLYHAAYGVPFVALRLFTIYGPRQRPDMAFHRFIRSIRSGETVEVYGDGRQTRDFTYVADVVAALRAAADAPRVEGEAINVGGGSRVTLRDAIDLLAAIVGRPAAVAHRPPARGDATHTFAAIGKAERLLGYRPRTSLSDGLREEVRWLERSGAGSRGGA